MIINAPINYYDQVQFLGIGEIQTYQIYSSGVVVAFEPYISITTDSKTTVSLIHDEKSNYNVMSGWHHIQ